VTHALWQIWKNSPEPRPPPSDLNCPPSRANRSINSQTSGPLPFTGVASKSACPGLRRGVIPAGFEGACRM
jgi:hypothetical protein